MSAFFRIENLSKTFVRVFALTIVGASSIGIQTGNAAEINAASCSLAHVQAAVNAADLGDTVQIPAGSCSWSGGLSISGIQLVGAGKSTSGTVITSGTVTVTKHPSQYTRLSGFRFTGSARHVSVDGSPSNRPFIVDNNYFFTSGGTGGSTMVGISVNGGLLHHNDFTAANPTNADVFNIRTGEDWSQAATFGNTDTNGERNIYFEDNVFTNILETAPDGDVGGRFVIRHNTYRDSSIVFHSSAPVDSGDYSGGTRQFEIYNNVFERVSNSAAINKWIWARGGSGVIANNTINRAESPDGSSFPNKHEILLTIGCPGPYPLQYQVGQSNRNPENPPSHPLLIFGNTGAGASDGDFIAVAGSGTAGPSCVNATSYIRVNRDYYLSNHWNWTPYTYPHPLQSLGGGGTPPPTDTAPPSVPTNVSATVTSSSQINLTWSASTDNVGVNGYRVERCLGASCTNFTQIATPTATSYSNTGLSGNTTYRYRIRATDAAGNLSGYSSVVNGTTQAGGGGGPAPLPEGNVGIAASFPGDVNIQTNANVLFADDFESYTSASQLTTRWNSFYQGSNTRIATEAANRFAGSKALEFTLPASSSEVSNAVVKNISPTQDTLFVRVYTKFESLYDINTDSNHNGIRISAQYQGPGNVPNGADFFMAILENSKFYGEADPGYSHVYIYHPEQRHEWGDLWFPDGRVLPFDQTPGNFGSNFVPRPDFIPQKDRWYSYEFMVKANTPGQRDGRIAYWIDGDLMADFQNVRVRDISTLKIDQIQLELHAQAGGSSRPNKKWYDNLVVARSYIGPVSGGTPPPTDTTPPSVPTNLTDTTISSSQINLSWTASTDNVGVTGYRVERCLGASCTNFVQIATPNGTSHSDTGLAGGTTYRYRVRATDAAGNLSGYSAIASGTTQAGADTTDPSVPTNLTDTTISSSQINLSWTASTDNVGVTGYRVERCQGASCTNFAQIATPTGTSHSDTGLSSGTTYRYRVRAADAAGNLSAYSAIASGTTQNPSSNRFNIGDRIITVMETLARDNPSLSGNELGLHPVGHLGTIIGGPTVADGMTWWQINYDNNPDGWSGHEDRFEKHTAKFVMGDRIITVMETLARDNPSLSGNELGLHPVGHLGTIVGGPTVANGMTWWQINYDTAPDGWSGHEDRFDKFSAFAQKCTQPGVLGCFGFDSPSSLFYTWPAGTACDAHFSGQTNHTFGPARSGPGNTRAVVQNGQCVFPQIDTSGPHTGAGSLKFEIPSNSSADSSGGFTEPFKRNSDGTFPSIGPGSSLGNVVYFQFYQKFDSNFLTTDFQCVGVSCPGWKQATLFGNPPNALGTSLETAIMNAAQRGVAQMYGQQGSDNYGVQDVIGCTQANAVSQGGAGSGFGSQSNYRAPLNPSCINYVANQWMEFTGRIEIRGASNAPASRIQLWINGQLAIDFGTAKIDWDGSDGTGFGQFLLSPFHATKDPNRAHADAFTWYDDLVVSTQPIAMVAPPADTIAPAVSLTAPANGTTVSATVSVTANATDNVGVAGVQFKLDGANVGAEDTTAPYSVSWNTTTATNGSHTLTAVARDAAGNTTTSSAITVIVSNPDTTDPVVSVTAPTDGSTVSASITVSASASDNLGIVGVQFQVDGVNHGAEDTTVPYSVSWNTTAVSDGSHTLTAVARDAAGNTTTSSAITVIVSTPDTTDPVVSLTAPVNGSTVFGSITVSASASDNVAVAGVQFQVDGVNHGAEDMTAPYSVSWDTAAISNGSHSVRAIARDAAGNTTTSSVVTVTVNNADTTAPVVSVTAPTAGSTVSGSITVSASASDNLGIVGVQFQLDGANHEAEDTTAPYSITWNTTTVANGSYTFRAVARDAAGNTTTSSAVTITVNNPDTMHPLVSLNEPVNGSTVFGSITLTAAASDNLGVAGVQFQLNGANYGVEDTTAPYSIAWDTTAIANGSYAVTALARDAAGNTTTSAAVTITVNNPDTTNPAVSVTTPANGSTVFGSIAVSASASDNVGVVGVQFQVDGVNHGPEDTTAPYSVSWNTAAIPNGSHSLRAIARDAAGNTTTSAVISVTVANNQAPVVNAGPNKTVTLLAGATLNGAATDDGLPSGTLTLQWSVVSGGIALFSAPQSGTTHVTFTLPGTYVLRLTATDGHLTTTDEVTVIVNLL